MFKNAKRQFELHPTIQGIAYAVLLDITVDTSPLSISLSDGSVTLKAVKVPQSAPEMIGWTTDNAEIVTVNDDGVITPVQVGTTKIYVQNASGTIRKEVSVSVVD